MKDSNQLPLIQRIADALERLDPPLAASAALDKADAFVWHADGARLEAVAKVSRIDLDLLRGVDQARDTLLDNTRRFAKGLPANNALLWGARGTGKSSLVKAVHAAVDEAGRAAGGAGLALIEIHREDLASLPALLRRLRGRPRRFLLFCDDLSVDGGDTSYKSLKAVLEGGVEGRPANVLFYATSDRRHPMPREMIEDERSTAINPGEVVEE